jgi:hypothetical protein
MRSDGPEYSRAPEVATNLRDQLWSASETTDLTNQPRRPFIDPDDLIPRLD